jgi:multicomponent Na+:H+ antiporter subunit D
VEEAATARGWGWTPVVFVIVTALTGGAVLRAGARIFLGLGVPAPRGSRGTEAEGEAIEHERARGRTPAALAVPMVLLLVLGLGMGVTPGVRHGIDRAAAAFADRPAYATTVLAGRPVVRPHGSPATGPHASSVVLSVLSVGGALGCAGLALFAPGAARIRPVSLAGRALHAWHSGHLGDYATWTVAGAAVLGWALAVAVR